MMVWLNLLELLSRLVLLTFSSNSPFLSYFRGLVKLASMLL